MTKHFSDEFTLGVKEDILLDMEKYAKYLRSNPDKAKEFLIKCKIIDAQGNLRRPFGGTAD